MMFPSNRVRVLVSTQPVDFRKGHDGLPASATAATNSALFIVFDMIAPSNVRLAVCNAIFFFAIRNIQKSMSGDR
jgi:hypothetical protein